MGVFKRKLKKETPRIEHQSGENEEDIYDLEEDEGQEDEDDDRGEEEDSDEDERELPPMPKPNKKLGRPMKQKAEPRAPEEPEQHRQSQQYNVSEHLDMIEGNIKRVFVALVEFRKINKV